MEHFHRFSVIYAGCNIHPFVIVNYHTIGEFLDDRYHQTELTHWRQGVLGCCLLHARATGFQLSAILQPLWHVCGMVMNYIIHSNNVDHV